MPQMNNKTSIYPALVLMTRWPVVNKCKSRLAKDIGPDKAALIQRELFLHTISVAGALQEKKLVELHIAISGITVKSALRFLDKKIFKNINNQGEGNLGLRVRRQFIRVQLNNQRRSTIVIGTDLPTLCERDIIEAIEELRTNQLVLGPSTDGGYWLLGLSGGLLKPVAIWPFVDIQWGSSKVLGQTLRIAEKEGIKYSLLSENNDIDLLEDLRPWQ